VTEENIQARLRGVILMALSNKFGALLLTTGNKSELAVGYCTLYGDMCGGLAVISDVPKTMIYRLARWINRGARDHSRHRSPNRPRRSCVRTRRTRIACRRMRCWTRFSSVTWSKPKVSRRSCEPGTIPGLCGKVARLIDASEYKRRQAAPG
jgi:NAD+ synthase (glutamine-hydrolysing)